MTSPNNAVISLPAQSIADAEGSIWTIVNGQVTVNGIIGPTTANVIEVGYENGVVWQKNTDNLWWSKASRSASWDPPYGTSIDPIPNQVASVNDTIVTVIPNSTTASITDMSGNIWSISGGQATLNGAADPTTANVIELAYVNGRIWQGNTNDLWWSKGKPSDPWEPTCGTATRPVADVARTWSGEAGTFATPGDWTPNGGSRRQAIRRSSAVGRSRLRPASATASTSACKAAGWSSTSPAHSTPARDPVREPCLINHPGQVVTVTTTGIEMNGGETNTRQFSSVSGGLTIQGNSQIAGGAVLDDHLVGTGSLPYAPVVNDGTMTSAGSTVAIGSLSGQGTIRAIGNSSLSVLSVRPEGFRVIRVG